MMVYNTQDCWVLDTVYRQVDQRTQKKVTFQGLDLLPSPGEWWETPTLLGPIEITGKAMSVYLQLYEHLRYGFVNGRYEEIIQ
jgi:hypothetical protein